MRPLKIFGLSLIVASLFLPNAKAIDAVSETAKPQIEVAFVLDTTGSMQDLIDGAKRKIWSIANQIIDANPRPEVKFSLVGYRDRGDVYITKVFNLTSDLDSIYGELQKFDADGGGDTPESVNQALNEAVTKIQWSSDAKTLRLIFLVGDAPPQMNYKKDTPYSQTVKLAFQKDIVINTVLCGDDPETAQIWKEIAKSAQGKFVAIAQQGGMQTLVTPMDDELSKLNDEVAKTAILYGKKEVRSMNQDKISSYASAPAESKADQLSYKNKSLSGGVITSQGDLVEDVKNKIVTLDTLKEEDLPADFAKLPQAERAAYLKAQTAKRGELQTKITDLVKQRDAYILAEQKKSGDKDGFDEQVKLMIREQGLKKGIHYP